MIPSMWTYPNSAFLYFFSFCYIIKRDPRATEQWPLAVDNTTAQIHE